MIAQKTLGQIVMYWTDPGAIEGDPSWTLCVDVLEFTWRIASAECMGLQLGDEPFIKGLDDYGKRNLLSAVNKEADAEREQFYDQHGETVSAPRMVGVLS